jgi:hypothetical protein
MINKNRPHIASEVELRMRGGGHGDDGEGENARGGADHEQFPSSR